MSRLIDADELYLCKFVDNTTDYNAGWNDALYFAALEAPTVDAVPVIRGSWLKRGIDPNAFYECSECFTIGSPAWKCCPVCTARMNLEADDGKDD